MKETIICGFAGVGKSYLAKNKESFVDLESTPFKKNWDLYSDVAIYMQKNGYTPLLSCHEELRNILKHKGADYVVVIPEKSHKDNYIERYKKRGNDDNFIKLLDENFEKWIDEIEKTETNVIKIPAPNWTLADIILILNNLKNKYMIDPKDLDLEYPIDPKDLDIEFERNAKQYFNN